jgi:pimeloyl-ACP methyl ester carboxylesterase
MLLLHGALGAASQFEPLRNALPDTLSVHAPDFMGHGSRALPGSPFSILRLVDQVVELIESQGLQGTPCFGYSMGGYVALVIAATRPGLLGQVTTLATRFAWSPDVTAREMAQLDPDVIAAKVPRFATTLEARHVAAGWRQLCAATARLLQELGDAPLLNDAVFSRITIPVNGHGGRPGRDGFHRGNRGRVSRHPGRTAGRLARRAASARAGSRPHDRAGTVAGDSMKILRGSPVAGAAGRSAGSSR